jgi:crotonobetainyl-CoA:carnitine CoA-transferase CaiB-like acyl-CoA transferase
MTLLADVRVLDVTTTFLGPYCTLMLAELGADVIKVESPAGDITRALGPGADDGASSIFLTLNRGKRSVVLDLKHDECQRTLRRLLVTADVLIHNMRPAAAQRLGLDYESVIASRPDIIHCAAHGFGSGGPYADRPAYDDIIQGVSGLAHLQGLSRGEEPQYVASVVADKIAGLTAANAVLAALYRRARTGQGQGIEVPMFETMVVNTMLEQLGGAAFEPAQGDAYYSRTISTNRRPYATTDGYVSALLYTDEHWRRFLARTGASNEQWLLVGRDRQARIGDAYALLEQVIAKLSTDETLTLFEAIDAPAMPVRSIPELFDDEHLQAVGLFESYDHPTAGRVRGFRSPVSYSEPLASLRPAPGLGEHTAEVLAELGVAADGAT